MQSPPSSGWPALDPEARDTREFVYELKFYVAEAVAGAMLPWVRSHLAPDPHGTGSHGDTYRVSSIYFDTAGHDVLARRGSFARSKYRVRRYGDRDGGQVFLERKTRGQYRVYKRRSGIPATALPTLLAGRPERGWNGHWFHRRLLARGLSPVTRVDYQRIARIGQSSYGPLRLTLDQELSAWQARELAFLALAPGVALAPGQRILELKFGNALPAVFKALIHEFAPRLTGISKYRLASQALGLAAPVGSTRSLEATTAGLASAAGAQSLCEPLPPLSALVAATY